VNWTPADFIIAISGTFAVIIVIMNVLSAVSEWLERKLIEWWTKK
jgi:CHASE3 domain sensor protein